MTDVLPENNATPPPKKPAAFTYAPGSQPLPGYVIKRGLGEGGFGEVYYALSDAGKEVALKVVRRHLDIELRGVSQCLNLKHPNLVALYDVRVDAEGNHWIVMEYVAGERLCDALTSHPHGLPLEEALSWFRGIAAGVEYLHQNGIVHRDLKPANLFRENGVVKIGDYGLSKFISASRRSGHTESVGTVHYMAPEISGGRYGKEIDVYSLGVILCEMLSGRVPFDGESVGEILMKHLTSEPDLTGLAEPYRGAIAAALQKDPALRPKTIGEFLQMVEGKTPAPVVVAPPPIVRAPPIRRMPTPRPEPAPTIAHPATPAKPSQAWIFASLGAVFVVLLFVLLFFVRAERAGYYNDEATVVPENASIQIDDGVHITNLKSPHSPGYPPPQSATAPQPTRAWLSIGVLGVLAIVAASFWSMRRMISPADPGSRPSGESSIVVDSTWRGVATDVTGSWLLLFVSTAVLSRLLLVLHGETLLFEQYVWTAATTFTATALLTLAGKWPGGMMHARHGRRIRNSLIGAAVGGVSWLLADYLGVALPSGYQMTRFADAWPECFVDGKPTWLAFVGYFGLSFFLVDWQQITDPRRRSLWRFGNTAVAVFWACVVYFFFPFPQWWGVLVVAGTTVTLPFVFPIAEQARMHRAAAGRVA